MIVPKKQMLRRFTLSKNCDAVKGVRGFESRITAR